MTAQSRTSDPPRDQRLGSASTPILEVRGVDIRYGSTPVVANASFTVAQGEFITLLGPSGSGKTSLLRTIAGFVKPTSGEILLQGMRMDTVPPYERDIGMVFQNYALFPHMSVKGNLSFGPRMMRMPRAEIETRVADALAQVRLSDYGARFPHELSGGQQQRVAIARALAMRPALLLLDEPMSNLDARLRAEMRVELVSLLKGLGLTSIAVTHNQEEALSMSDRVIVMAEGGIRQIGTPSEIYLHPADQFVANFVGDANVVRATHAGMAGEHAIFMSGWGQAINVAVFGQDCEQSTLLLVRPEAIELSADVGNEGGTPPGTNRICGRLLSRAYMGAFVELRAQVGDCEILVKVAAGQEAPNVQVGDPVLLHWKAESVRAIRA
jgi:ABC-type Fe3+/spermidine/putrescine transport system ATPase subunit